MLFEREFHHNMYSYYMCRIWPHTMRWMNKSLFHHRVSPIGNYTKILSCLMWLLIMSQGRGLMYATLVCCLWLWMIQSKKGITRKAIKLKLSGMRAKWRQIITLPSFVLALEICVDSWLFQHECMYITMYLKGFLSITLSLQNSQESEDAKYDLIRLVWGITSYIFWVFTLC